MFRHYLNRHIELCYFISRYNNPNKLNDDNKTLLRGLRIMNVTIMRFQSFLTFFFVLVGVLRIIFRVGTCK